MRRTISEAALERKQKKHLPANDLQTPTHSTKISWFKQPCRRDTVHWLGYPTVFSATYKSQQVLVNGLNHAPAISDERGTGQLIKNWHCCATD
jgi:hypothetical protein